MKDLMELMKSLQTSLAVVIHTLDDVLSGDPKEIRKQATWWRQVWPTEERHSTEKVTAMLEKAAADAEALAEYEEARAAQAMLEKESDIPF